MNENWKVERKTPWWKHPFVFDFSGIHMPCPYIWFGWWLITWETSDWSHDGKFHLNVSFQPD